MIELAIFTAGFLVGFVPGRRTLSRVAPISDIAVARLQRQLKNELATTRERQRVGGAR